VFAARPNLVRCLAGVALSLALLVGPASAGAATPSRIVYLLNRERILNSLPAGITSDATWTSACEQHNAYEHRLGGLSHDEIVGHPGYSAGGALIARTSVLAQGIYWGHGDPYDNAPYHLFDLLNPRISSVGAADSDGFGCVEIELGTVRPAPATPKAYSYPGDGRTGVPVSERAAEQPATPAQSLGLGERLTGPNLLVYFDGPWTDGSRLRLQEATLDAGGGSVSLRWLDNTTSDLLAPTGAILVPVRPLRPGTRYRVSVKGTVSGLVPGTTIEEALGSCGETASGVDCGQPPPSACLEDFATQLAVCGLSRTWAVEQRFSFTTARNAG
jgi:hypothetical protein